MNRINTGTQNNGDRIAPENAAFEDAIRLATIRLNAATLCFRDGYKDAGKDREHGAKGVLDAVKILTGRDICIAWDNLECTSYSLVENLYEYDENTVYSYRAPAPPDPSDNIKQQAGFREQTEKVANDFLNKEHEFIKSSNLSLSDFRALQRCLDEYARKGETRVFISNVANIFKKYGFSVEYDENRVNYVIKADSAKNTIDTNEKIFIRNVPYCLNQKMRELGCKWDADAKCWYHIDPAKAREAERLVAEVREYRRASFAQTGVEKITHEF